MTCRDCKAWNTCQDKYKSDKVDKKYGDSYADYCDEFDTIYGNYVLNIHGYKIIQNGYNWHIMIWGRNGWLMHATCTARISKERIRKIYKLYQKRKKEQNNERIHRSIHL